MRADLDFEYISVLSGPLLYEEMLLPLFRLSHNVGYVAKQGYASWSRRQGELAFFAQVILPQHVQKI